MIGTSHKYIMPRFVIVNEKACTIGACNIASPLDAHDTIFNTFPWRRTDKLTLYNTDNIDKATLATTLTALVNKGYVVLNDIYA